MDFWCECRKKGHTLKKLLLIILVQKSIKVWWRKVKPVKIFWLYCYNLLQFCLMGFSPFYFAWRDVEVWGFNLWHCGGSRKTRLTMRELLFVVHGCSRWSQRTGSSLSVCKHVFLPVELGSLIKIHWQEVVPPVALLRIITWVSTVVFGEVLGMYCHYWWRAREKGVGLGCRL